MLKVLFCVMVLLMIVPSANSAQDGCINTNTDTVVTKSKNNSYNKTTKQNQSVVSFQQKEIARLSTELAIVQRKLFIGSESVETSKPLPLTLELTPFVAITLALSFLCLVVYLMYSTFLKHERYNKDKEREHELIIKELTPSDKKTNTEVV